MPTKAIVLLTDFGDSDSYVGIMKGVISQIAPELKTIDLSHKVPPGDIQQGAFQLWQAAPFFPAASVFLAVVDPGVGTPRKGIFFQRGDQVFIGPDNGLFTYLGFKSTWTAWELANPDYQLAHLSSTFHGRDLFAPAAAHAALGVTGDQFGNAIISPIQLPPPTCQAKGNQLSGEVISVDQFGNLITSLGQFRREGEDLLFNSWIENSHLSISGALRILLPQTGTSLALVHTFADIPPGEAAGLLGSSGLLEVAANRSSAAELLGLSRGDPITMDWK